MKNKILTLVLLAGLNLCVNAQDADNVTGLIRDKMDNPIAGTMAAVDGSPFLRTATNKNDEF